MSPHPYIYHWNVSSVKAGLSSVKAVTLACVVVFFSLMFLKT